MSENGEMVKGCHDIHPNDTQQKGAPEHATWPNASQQKGSRQNATWYTEQNSFKKNGIKMLEYHQYDTQ